MVFIYYKYHTAEEVIEITSCPENKHVELPIAEQMTGVEVTWTLPTATSTTKDGTVNIDGDLVEGDNSGSLFYTLGITTITYQFHDAVHEQSIKCSFNISLTLGKVVYWLWYSFLFLVRFNSHDN